MFITTTAIRQVISVPGSPISSMHGISPSQYRESAGRSGSVTVVVVAGWCALSHPSSSKMWRASESPVRRGTKNMRDACTVGACAAAIVNHAPFKSTGLKVLDCREISSVVVDVTSVATLTGASSILRTIGPHSPALLNATSAVTVGFEVVTAATQDTFGVTVAISSPSFGNQKGYCTPPVG